jgi:hypothetical protein
LKGRQDKSWEALTFGASYERVTHHPQLHQVLPLAKVLFMQYGATRHGTAVASRNTTASVLNGAWWRSCKYEITQGMIHIITVRFRLPSAPLPRPRRCLKPIMSNF